MGLYPRPWRLFAFNAAETATDMLTAAELADYLVDTVAKNGNVLINVGPDSFMATFLTSSKLHSLSLVTGCTSMARPFLQPDPEYDSETRAVERYVIPKVRLHGMPLLLET